MLEKILNRRNIERAISAVDRNHGPLLSNIMLHELDQELNRRGLRFVRYADDCSIYVKSEKSAKRVVESIIKYIEGKLLLKVNRGKRPGSVVPRKVTCWVFPFTKRKGDMKYGSAQNR